VPAKMLCQPLFLAIFSEMPGTPLISPADDKH